MCAGLKKEELKIKFVEKGSLIISGERHLSPSHKLLSLSGPYLSFPPTPLSLSFSLSPPLLSPPPPNFSIYLSYPLLSLSLSLSLSLNNYDNYDK